MRLLEKRLLSLVETKRVTSDIVQPSRKVCVILSHRVHVVKGGIEKEATQALLYISDMRVCRYVYVCVRVSVLYKGTKNNIVMRFALNFFFLTSHSDVFLQLNRERYVSLPFFDAFE